ncbi:MAG: 4-hydroxy-tetrahydrodipicolinate synthase [Defluviitaleaceae bacterium]|nr:4-hydroxy-tetrahydrodipicolinate synthase [Defluviitaleaceae bacterium]
MSKKPPFTGAGIAITTPFKEDLSIDYELFEKHIDFLIKNKADAIVVAGTTGESATLSFNEKMELTRVAKERVKSRAKIIAGAGSNNTAEVLKLSNEYEKIGVDTLMIVTPYYNKASQKGLINHYTEIANKVNTQIMLYNVPSRTGLNMSANTISKLAKHENISCIKEASGDFTQIAEIAEKTFSVDNFHIYAGNDDQILAMKALGAVGAVTVAGNIIPEVIHNLFTIPNEESNLNNSNVKNNFSDNYYLDLQLSILEFVRAIFSEVSPAPIKAALTELELSTNYLRPPMYEMENKEVVINAMKNLGVL